jgi:hypothetical protein
MSSLEHGFCKITADVIVFMILKVSLRKNLVAHQSGTMRIPVYYFFIFIFILVVFSSSLNRDAVNSVKHVLC